MYTIYMTDIHKLYGLAFNCPYLERQDDCLLKVIEQLSFKEKVNWVNGLSQDFKQKILEKHKNCSANRV